MAQLVKNLPAMRETSVQSLGWEDPLEGGMATHSSILAWRIRMDRGLHVAPHGLAGYSPWGHKQSDMTEQLSTAHIHISFTHSFLPHWPPFSSD